MKKYVHTGTSSLHDDSFYFIFDCWIVQISNFNHPYTPSILVYNLLRSICSSYVPTFRHMRTAQSPGKSNHQALRPLFLFDFVCLVDLGALLLASSVLGALMAS